MRNIPLLILNPIFGFQVAPGIFKFEYFANFCHFKVFNRTLEQLSCKTGLIFIFFDNYLVLEDFQDWSGMFFQKDKKLPNQYMTIFNIWGC